MAVQLASNIAPKNGQTYYMVEDIYFKGGLQIRDNIAARDAIAGGNLKIGQLVLTLADSKIWKLKTNDGPTAEAPDTPVKIEWEEFLTNSTGGGGLEDAPKDGQQYARKDGEWVVVASADGPVPISPNSRGVALHTIENLAVSASEDFTLDLAVSCIMLKLTVSRPVKLSAYSTSNRDDINPYQFLATDDHLTDDGSMLLADGTVFRSRNFSIIANMEEPASNTIYWTVEGVDEQEGPVAITITYLPLEIIATEEDPTDPTDPVDPAEPTNP